MSLNRIYQGRVSKVEIANPSPTAVDNADRWLPLPDWPGKIWAHHLLFQDAVNYNITAIAALGSSPDSPLTKLRQLLGEVWESADKKGQSREGMGESFKRIWNLDRVPTLGEVIARFQQPLLDNGVAKEIFEAAGENMVNDISGETAIQQKGRTYWPLFCDPDTTANSPDDETALNRGDAKERIKQVIHAETTRWDSPAMDEFAVTSIALPNNKKPLVQGSEARGLLADAIAKLSGQKALENDPDGKLKALVEQFQADAADADAEFKKLSGLLAGKNDDALEIAGFSGASAKGQIGLFLRAFLLFRHVEKSPFTFALLRHFCPPAKKLKNENAEDKPGEYRVVPGAIRKARGNHGYIFRAFTSLPIWKDAQGSKPAWSQFDIAAFKEALKVWNQFKQNVEKREGKLNAFAAKLLVMAGENAIAQYDGDEEPDLGIRSRLKRIWDETGGKPKPPMSDGENEEAVIASFSGDPRIERLQKIVTIDLAEEYRLTEGRKTPYGLRRRTMKGWDIVKREWRKIVKPGTPFSEKTKQKLQAMLDDLRGGEKREQIGSHKLFTALIADEAAWQIWREPDGALQKLIEKNNWAADPLEAFRDYYETCEAFEEITQRPLRFTPADAKFSRRLFMFSDVCSFGKDTGEYRHDLKNTAVMVPVALCGDDGKHAMTTCRLVYSAPRLLRDRIRETDGTLVQDWTQPMTRALFGENEIAPNPQQLKDAAVALMPDFDSKNQRRFLLNFPLTLDEEKIKKHIGKAALWEKQFVTWKKGKQLPFVRWDADFKEDDDKTPRWWKNEIINASGFRVLSADLGTRHAASVALLECGKTQAPNSRFIGEVEGKAWFARYRAGKILRLPGEDAQVLRLPTRLDKDAGKSFREELYGDRGRSADEAETREFAEMLAALGQEKMLEHNAALSFPEQNDKLLVAIRRAQNWVAACVSWLWKLENPEDAKEDGSSNQREATLTEIGEHTRVPDWHPLAKNAGNKEAMQKLGALINAEITRQRVLIEGKLLRLTHRILPLRGRNWEWVKHPESSAEKFSDCRLLRQTAAGTGPEKILLAGQRGLGIERIEQLGELRRRWQSLNQSLRVTPGNRPPTTAEMRNTSIPDPCPDILAKLENIREQRVNQTAHLILAEALGLKLREPQLSAKHRATTDTHGEYQVIRPPADFIVLEDLTRYLSDQGRAKRENSRLMKWCHRAITEKLKMLAEPFGLAVLETQAAYTSRFCSLTGIAGFRAVEVGLRDKTEFRWRTALELAAKEKSADETARKEWEKLSADKKKELTRVEKLFADLEKLENAGVKNPTLLAPQPGGPVFVTAKNAKHPIPVGQRFDERKKKHGAEAKKPSEYLLPMQADLNAAINIALRAIAHPSCADIHHRVRTERKKDASLTREARRFGKAQPKIVFADTPPKEKNTNLFLDQASVAPNWGRARLASDGNTGTFPYATGSALWKTVNDWDFQWRRCEEINAIRLGEQEEMGDVVY